MSQLKIIPAFGRSVHKTVYDQVEKLLKAKAAINSFESWLQSRSIVFNDGRCFDYQALGGRGYNVASANDLPRLIRDWEDAIGLPIGYYERRQGLR